MATPIRSLKPFEFHELIIVRICREWPNKDYRTGHVITYDYLLVDDEVKNI